MARQIRVEFEGAFYHVMARGDRREAIVKDDEDRKTFVRTLGEAAAKAGFRIHAFVLMDNHYHLLLETPKANLSAGMGWMQNAFTRWINVRHALWGHVFGQWIPRSSTARPWRKTGSRLDPGRIGAFQN